ncbi:MULTISPECIES: hypothetical protein [Deefgea]|uniref:Transcription factor zinc-finger domain-containing protein n=1 Tax=Deefgea chitinilytica TaxID=570276 RepID=A0ABS2CHJ9_9NEIS|nr:MULTISPECIES: hypothetical protein [Deefgea]MBM5572918.1 hypothetical protein [Deefgea chitinilytica]MBM9890154.1 hypothetical protein [Deefgea sp. CFH1-16]
MNCTSCGAEMAADAIVCEYCGLHNAVDVLAIRDFKVLAEHSNLICPEGCGELQLLQLDADLNVTVAHCPSCNGLKFSPGALQIIIEKYAKKIQQLNIARISNIVSSRLPRSPFKLLSCPVCKKDMSRHYYHPQLKIEVDECLVHGVWLKRGELSVIADLWVELSKKNQKLSGVELGNMLVKEKVARALPEECPAEISETPRPNFFERYKNASTYIWVICIVSFLYQCTQILNR